MMTIKEIFQLPDTIAISRALLGHLLIHETPLGPVGGYIVDTESYLGPLDAASHSYGGKNTPSLKAMYQEPGRIYLYVMHTHLLLNLVTQPAGVPEGVMIRAIEPAVGIHLMEKLRGKKGPGLSNGPGKLTAALGLTRKLYGQSIFSSSLKVTEEHLEPKKIITAPRIGVPNKGIWTTAPLRVYVAGNPYVSKIKKSDLADNLGWRTRK